MRIERYIPGCDADDTRITDIYNQ
ncbi:hypothetical protein KIPB_015729, partial [Kipferlia bialata]|eukprot:g15729.t1